MSQCFEQVTIESEGPLRSYGSWIYNYLYNQCLSPIKLWVPPVRTRVMARCTRYNIMW